MHSSWLTRRPWLAAALCAGLTLPPAAAPAAAQTPLVGRAWQLFEWFSGAGPIEGDGFRLVASRRTRVRVTDLGVSGDAFRIFVNGSPFEETPTVAGGTFTGALGGDAAWEDERLSKREFFLDAGQYTITLAVRETAPGFDHGEGAIRADDAPLVGVVPEPATLVLLGGGLVVLGLASARTRRTA